MILLHYEYCNTWYTACFYWGATFRPRMPVELAGDASVMKINEVLNVAGTPHALFVVNTHWSCQIYKHPCCPCRVCVYVFSFPGRPQ